jgi:hypothetical protein
VHTWTVDSSARPAAAWALMSRPSAWPAWAPHMRGFWSRPPLGDGEVEVGAWGAAWVVGVPVPARVIGKRARREWTWQFGLAQVTHRVEPRRGGCRLAIDLRAPGPLERVLVLAWGPVFALSLRNLARVAEREAQPVS